MNIANLVKMSASAMDSDEQLKASPSELFTLCISRQWDEALAYVKTHPKEATDFLYPGKRGSAPITALQTLLANVKCRGDAPIELIQKLLDTSPDLAFKRHIYTGNIPMHAVFYNPFYSAAKRAQIAQIILRSAGPKSITMINKDGRAPLHTICSQHCNFEPLSLLLEAAPQVASWEDNQGNLPIHLACRSIKVPLKSIIILNSAYPNGITHRNFDGMTPLQVAIQIASNAHDSSKARSLINFLTKMEASFVDSSGNQEPGGHHHLGKREEDTYTRSKVQVQPKKKRKRYSAKIVLEERFCDYLPESRDDVEDPPPLYKRVKFETPLSSPEPSVHAEARDAEESPVHWSWVEEISPHILLSMKIETV